MHRCESVFGYAAIADTGADAATDAAAAANTATAGHAHTVDYGGADKHWR